MKIAYEPIEFCDGWIVRRFIDDGRPMYLKHVYNGQYEFTHDKTYARVYTIEKHALEQILRLALRDKTQPADFITVHVDRRNA